MIKKNKLLFVLAVSCLAAAVTVGRFEKRKEVASLVDRSMADGNDISDGETCRLLHVVDGDTISVRCNGRKRTVRLLRIDTPERNERGYEEAGNALTRLLGDAPIRLVAETPGHFERDRFGRLLAYVYAGGKNVNVEIVRQGWSRFWTKYGRGRMQTIFEEAEQEARRGRTGLWSHKLPILGR